MILQVKRPMSWKTSSGSSVRLLFGVLLTAGFLVSENFLMFNASAQDFGEEFNQIDRAPEAEAAPPPLAAPPPPPVEQSSFEPAVVTPAPVESAPVEPSAPVEAGTPAPAPAPASVPVSTPVPITVGTPTDPLLTRISIGEVIPGVLGQADYVDTENRRVELYQFTGRANESIAITLTNSNDVRPDGLRLTPYMRVLNLSAPEEQQVIGGTITPGSARIPTENPLIPVDNQVYLRLPQAGEYGIVVYTDPGIEGRYGLTVNRDRTRYFIDTLGELTDANKTLNADGSPYSAAEFHGDQGQTVHINLTSPDFDSYLFLVNEDGEVIAEDDNSGGNLNARIETELPAEGNYYVVVNSRNAEGRGRYRLTIY